MADTQNPIDPKLVAAFGQDKTRFLLLSVDSRNDNAVSLVHEQRAGVSPKWDFGQIRQHLPAHPSPAIVLFKRAPNVWLYVAYVPDDAPPAERMVYASAGANIRKVLDPDEKLILTDLHASCGSELVLPEEGSGSEAAVVKPFSKLELARQNIALSEAAEAAERAVTVPGASTGGKGIGGYHSVKLPFTEGARSAVAGLQRGEMIKLSIAENAIDATDPPAKDGANGPRLSQTDEPRFYVYRPERAGAAAVFVYACPDNSPAKLRMVYSTAKAPAAEQAAEALRGSGVSLAAKQLEVRDDSDLSDGLRDADRPGRLAAAGGHPMSALGATLAKTFQPGAGPAASKFGAAKSEGSGGGTKGTVSKVGGGPDGQHPIYGLINAGNSSSSSRKKIVIPPKGAW